MPNSARKSVSTPQKSDNTKVKHINLVKKIKQHTARKNIKEDSNDSELIITPKVIKGKKAVKKSSKIKSKKNSGKSSKTIKEGDSSFNKSDDSSDDKLKHKKVFKVANNSSEENQNSSEINNSSENKITNSSKILKHSNSLKKSDKHLIRKPTISQIPQTPKKKVGKNILKEIKFYRSTIGFIISKALLARQIRDVIGRDSEFRITKHSFDLLQEALEHHIISILELANLATHHAKRVTLFASDIRLVRRILDYSK